jgi:class 3 adenylate cyclase
MNVSDLLKDLGANVAAELDSKPDVENKDTCFDIDKLPIDARKWHQLSDVVAVSVDLKNSTRLHEGKHHASAASIYEASTANVVRIFKDLEADYIIIQGDGGFALYWGENRLGRAMVAAITVKTFSERELVNRLEKKWPDQPDTGLRIGVARGTVLVKKVGVGRSKHQEPAWVGDPVNFASKCARSSEPGQLVVTASVWDEVSKNDYLAYSCDCSGPSDSIWKAMTIATIDESQAERDGRVLSSAWCANCGDDFAAAILKGGTRRESAKAIREQRRDERWAKAIDAKGGFRDSARPSGINQRRSA